MSGRRIIWVLAGVLFAAVTVWVHYEVKVKMLRDSDASGGGSVEQSGTLTVGEEIPDFAAIDLDGANVTLSEFRDREVVVLDFWATWCQPCIQSMPALHALNDEFDERGAEFLAVNVGEEPELVRDFLQDKEFAVRVVMDEQEDSSGAATESGEFRNWSSLAWTAGLCVSRLAILLLRAWPSNAIRGCGVCWKN